MLEFCRANSGWLSHQGITVRDIILINGFRPGIRETHKFIGMQNLKFRIEDMLIISHEKIPDAIILLRSTSKEFFEDFTFIQMMEGKLLNSEPQSHINKQRKCL